MAGLCCTAVVLFVHASDCGFIQLPQPPSKGVRGPGTIVQRPSKDSAPQPNQLQSPSASHAEAQTVAESSLQSIAEATAESVVEATPQSVAVATPQSVADATAEAVAKATPQSGKEATLNATIKPNADSTTQPATASAVNIAAIVSDELKYELETHTKPVCAFDYTLVLLPQCLSDSNQCFDNSLDVCESNAVLYGRFYE